MTLTVADIDRWNAGAVREVFQAANARGQATLEASRQLSTLSVFDTWEGATAEARKHVNAGIRQDLDAHGNEALAVARAADQAADGIEHVQSDLRTLRHDAAEMHMAIDATTNTLVPTADCLPIEAFWPRRSCSHGSTRFSPKPTPSTRSWPPRSTWPTATSPFRPMPAHRSVRRD